MRENGFYWIKAEAEWTCGKWDNGVWVVAGWVDRPWTDVDIDEIDERRILRFNDFYAKIKILETALSEAKEQLDLAGEMLAGEDI